MHKRKGYLLEMPSCLQLQPKNISPQDVLFSDSWSKVTPDV
jgi:hypothetical protein